MGISTMCPACGSDWCTGCECVQKKLEAAENLLLALIAWHTRHRRSLESFLEDDELAELHILLVKAGHPK